MRTFYHITATLSVILTLLFPAQLCAQALVKQYYTTTDKAKPGSNHLEKAKRALEKENMDAFWSHIRNARIKCPCQHKTHFLKGIALVKTDKLSQAERQFTLALESAMEEGQNLDTILYSIGQVYAMEGKYELASEYLNRVSGNIGGLGYYKRGLVNVNTGHFEEAIGYFLEHIRYQRGTPQKKQVLLREAKFNMAACHHGLGNYSIAETLLRESLSIGEDLNVRLALVELLFQTSRRPEAITELKEAVKRHMNDADTRNYLTNILLNEIKLGEAVLNNLLSRDRNSDHSSLTKGNLALRERKEHKALEHYKDVSKAERPLAYNGMATAHFNLGEVEKAEEIWDMVLADDPNDPVALEGMGIIQFIRGSFFLSKQYLTQAEEVDPSYMLSFDGLLCLGYIEILLSSYDTAIRQFTRGIEKSGRNQWAIAGIGYCKYEQGNLMEAIDWFTKAYKKDPSNPVFRGYMGVSQYWMSYLGGGRLGTDKFAKAQSNLEYAYSQGVQNPDIYNALALCYSENKRLDEAAQVIAEVRSLDPDNYQFWVNSGNIWSKIAGEHEKKNEYDLMNLALDTMMAHYLKAKELGLPEEVYLTNAGYGHVQAGQYQKAAELYNSMPATSSIKFNNLGALQALMGNRSAAQELFEKALEVEKKDPMLKMVYDVNVRRSYSWLARGSSFTSVYNFFMPLHPIKPELNYETNVPVLKVGPEMPEDEFQALLYNDRTLCEKKRVKVSSVRMDRPTKKTHFNNCL